MTQFVESMFRLYRDNKIVIEKIDALLASKKISRQEYDYIISAKKVV